MLGLVLKSGTTYGHGVSGQQHLRQACAALDTREEGRDQDGVEGVVG